MLFELVATLALGLGAAGVVMTVRFLSGGRLPGYLIPIVAGGSMLAFSIWGEYSWYSRMTATLPGNVIILEEFEQSIVLKPWTLVFPRIDRFSAVDLGKRRLHPDHPGLNMVDVYLVAHREPTATLQVFVDCPNQRRAEVDALVGLDDDGTPTDANWVDLDEGDPLLSSVCSG